MTSWAAPGVKCVCVDASLGLEADAVYTIVRTVKPYGLLVGRYRESSLGVVLAEITNPRDRDDGCFAVERFRPLITRSQEDDVALFRKLLVTEGADA